MEGRELNRDCTILGNAAVASERMMSFLDVMITGKYDLLLRFATGMSLLHWELQNEL